MSLFKRNKKIYKRGDNIRVLLENKREYIGEIIELEDNVMTMYNKSKGDFKIDTNDIDKIRLASIDEDFNNTYYFDDEEKTFWENHKITKISE